MKHEIKYILHPGPVVSKVHGEKDHVSARQLARLYRVNYAECQIAGTRGVDEKDKIHLWPRADGKYIIPNEVPREIETTEHLTLGGTSPTMLASVYTKQPWKQKT